VQRTQYQTVIADILAALHVQLVRESGRTALTGHSMRAEDHHTHQIETHNLLKQALRSHKKEIEQHVADSAATAKELSGIVEVAEEALRRQAKEAVQDFDEE
jgi:hypothetical protein